MDLATMPRPRRKMTCLLSCHGRLVLCKGGDCIILNSWLKGKASNKPIEAVSEDRTRTKSELGGGSAT